MVVTGACAGVGVGAGVLAGVIVCAGRTVMVRCEDKDAPSSDDAVMLETKETVPATTGSLTTEMAIVKFCEPNAGMLADLGEAEMLQHDVPPKESDTLLACAFPPFATMAITVPFFPGSMLMASDGKNDEMPMLGW